MTTPIVQTSIKDCLNEFQRSSERVQRWTPVVRSSRFRSSVERLNALRYSVYVGDEQA